MVAETFGNRTLDRLLTPAGDPIMRAKFLVPVQNTPVLERRRLLDLLTAAAAGPLTLISAPAGSGKTVLASSWVRSGAAPGPVAWVSLDEDDDQPGVFWTYVVAALENAGADLADVGLPDESARVDHSLLVRLAAKLSERTEPLVAVLDNAEAITSRRLFDELDFLIRHAAAGLRLVLVTRVDPGLPLPQYRLENALAEIRFPDLAFPPDEARQLLESRTPHLSDTAVRAFSLRTRGWAAGLRLADMPSSPADPDPAVVAVSDIAVYFRAEVLAAQPAEVRDFLLATSVVETLVPGLATHLSGLKEAEATLRVLAQASVFVEAVPDEPDSFRYHPLVRDLLTAQLRQEYPVRWRRLNRRAGGWLAGAGRTDDAVRRYAAAGDWEDAVGVVVRHRAVGRLLTTGPQGALASVLAALPPDVEGAAGAAVAAATALVRGDLDGCDKNLARAQERGTGDADPDLDLAMSLVALARSAAAGGVGGIAATQVAEAAVERAAMVGPLDAATAAELGYGRGCALLGRGELAPAQETLAEAVREADEAGLSHVAGLARARLALALALGGALADAEAAARAAADLISPDAHGCAHGPELAASAALAWVASERGEIGEALGQVRVSAVNRHRRDDLVAAGVLALVRCRLLRVRGDLPGALGAVDEFTRATAGLVPGWLEQRLVAAAVGVCLAQGRPEAALERLPRQGPDGDVAHLLAAGWTKLATGVAAESGRLARQALQPPAPLDLRVEAHLLAAASALALGQADTSVAALQEALALAGPAECRRPFDEAPARLKALLEQRRPQPALPRQAAPPSQASSSAAARAIPAPSRPRTPAVAGSGAGALVQPLTEREREVLGYLDALLPTEEIAARMFVSVNTVKTHVRAILRKLAAERRNEAVRRARELGLL